MANPPGDPNINLQAPLLNLDSSLNNHRHNNEHPNLITPEDNALIEVENYESTNFYICSVGLAILKILFSSVALSFEKTKCNQPIDLFLVYMRVHDLANGLLCGLRLASITLIPHDREVLLKIARFEARFKIITVLLIILSIYHLGLFIYANSLLFQPSSNCYDVAPTKHTLLIYYIVFTYIFYLGALGIFCVSFIYPYLCLAIYRSRRNSNTEPKRILAKMPVKKYMSDLKGDKECSICMNQYKISDKIVELQCSEMHYFHQGCIRKWLQINRHCPLCRQTIDKNGNKGEYIELERLTIINHQSEENL